jgi:ferric-dicitrate binding protein FerR (iron transport regulator)
MNARETKTNTRPKRRGGLVALLLATALLAAGGPAWSLASGPELQLACQGTSCGG